MLEVIFTENIITVTLSGLHQWDYGQKLYIKGLNLETIEEIHFSNNKGKEAIVRLLTKENEYYTATIPDELLHQGLDILAWIYDVGKNQGETIRTIIIKVEPRIKPENFIEKNPDAQLILEDAINTINENLKENSQFKEDMTNRQEEFENSIRDEIGAIIGIDDSKISDITTWSSQKINGEIETINNKVTNITEVRQVTLTTNWDNNLDQIVALEGIKPTDSPLIYVSANSNGVGNQNIIDNLEEWSKIILVRTDTDKLIFTCKEKTTKNLTVMVKGV